MSWKDEDIDKLFQDASQEKTFEFKEDFWNEMEALLPKKKKRRLPFIWIIGGVFLCAGVIGVLSVEDNYTNSSLTATHTNNTPKLLTNNSNSNQKTTIENKTTEEQRPAATVQSNEKVITEGEAISSGIDHSENKKYVSTPLEVTTHTSSGTNTINSPLNLTLAGGGFKNNDLPVGIEKMNPIIQIREKQLLDYMSILPVSRNEYRQVLQPGIIFGSSPKKWSVYFDFNVSMGQSPVTTNSLGSNFTYGIGLGTGINYSGKSWVFNAGISTTVTSYDNLYVKERVKVYGFGVQNFDNEIQYKNLFNAEIPLMAGVKSKNHTFQFGIVPSILIGSKISFKSTSNEQLYASSVVYGYRTGLVNFGLKPTIGYVYKITPTLQIGANVQMQLIAPIVTTLYEGETNGLPINGQVFIRKSLFLK